MKVPMNLRENRSFEIRLLKNMCGINDNIVKNIDNNREKNSNIESQFVFRKHLSNSLLI